MALKGTATIELTNADGSKEVIRHDNMITNAVNDLCFSQRGEMAAILKMVDNNASYAQSLFGGLLLFDEELNSDPDDYFIKTTKITGYASQNAYAGLDTARGSFNESEGGVQPDGSYKFVWDFSTSQGNGTIKSIALCPNVMGQIGASDTIVSSEKQTFNFVKAPTAPFNSYGYMLDSSGYTNGISNYYYNIVAIIGDIAYALDYYNVYHDSSNQSRNVKKNGGILKFYKFKLGNENISLADRVAIARYIECIDVQLPADFVSSLYEYSNAYPISYFFNQPEGKLIVFPCQLASDVAINGTIPYLDIDLINNMRISSYTFTNTTAGVFSKLNGGQSCIASDDAVYNFFVTKDYVVARTKVGTESRMYIVDRNDNTKVKKVMFAGSELYESEVNELARSFRPIFVNNNILVFAGIHVYILDMDTGVAKRTNARIDSFNSKANVSFGNKIILAKTGSYLTYYQTINPFILTTKNNLDSPVAKTASQTMKITYTLSELDESEV